MTAAHATSLVWFRDDLRVHDHEALADALATPGDTAAVYVLDEVSDGTRPLGGAVKWWLHHSLAALTHTLAKRGITLHIREGRADEHITQLCTELGVGTVLWNRRYGPERWGDEHLAEQLEARGVSTRVCTGNLLYEPWEVRTQQGTPYRVFTAWWRAVQHHPAPVPPLPAPPPLPEGEHAATHEEELEALRLLPTRPNWASAFTELWEPGEAGATARLTEFLEQRVHEYAKHRDSPYQAATSGLSPHLRFGELSPRTVWHAVHAANAGEGVSKFMTELGWRDFAWYTLWHTPRLSTDNIDARFDRFPWNEPDPDELTAWQTGTTGYPLVDAGMRELWLTGTMHNRARMVAASFLTKNLLTHWRVGEAWFWDTLVDADRASNPFNWQWVAGSGTDAAPYFRIFNPETQAKKCDPDGSYVNTWAPDSLIYQPLVDLSVSRQRALEAYRSITHT